MAPLNPTTPAPRGDEAGRQNVDHAGRLINVTNIIQSPEEQLAFFGTEIIRFGTAMIVAAAASDSDLLEWALWELRSAVRDAGRVFRERLAPVSDGGA